MEALAGYQDPSGMWHQVLDHPETFEETSCTAMFTLGLISLLLLSTLVSWFFVFPILFHMLLLMLSAFISNRSLGIGLLAVVTSYTQFLAYGFGFLKAFWRRIILRRGEFSAFTKNFYK